MRVKFCSVLGGFLSAGVIAACCLSPFCAAADWSGFHAGVQSGYVSGKANFVDDEYNAIGGFPTVYWDSAVRGLMTGFQSGYDWQVGKIVFGAEGEAGYLGITGFALQPGTDPFGVPYDAFGRVDPGWYGGFSTRVGYGGETHLFYVRAGMVYTAAEIVFGDTCVVAPCGDSVLRAAEPLGWGYQAGAGVEYKLGGPLVLRSEYAHMDFGTRRLHGRAQGGGSHNMDFATQADFSMHVMKFSLGTKL